MTQVNLAGIFSMANVRESMRDDVVRLTAEMMVAKMGAELSVFGLMHYFASYLTDYKDSFGKFDLQDVLRQCNKAYLPWWRSRVGRMEDAARQEATETEQTGKDALYSYLRREYIQKGRNVRESPLYGHGLGEKEASALEAGKL